MSDSKKLQELNKMYTDAETADKEVYAEMRSNVLLISGDHYAKKNWKFISSLRDNTALTNDQKIRLVKNHVNRIYKIYVNNIVSMAPGTTIVPKNEKELQDQKAAEMHKSVWQDIKQKLGYEEMVQQLAGDYVGLGEVFVKAYWDWEKGYLKKTEQQVEMGTDGQPQVVGETNKFSGQLVWERIFAFNVFRPSNCQSFYEAEWLGIRKMVPKDKLMEKYGEDEQIKKGLESDGETTFMVFDSNKAGYQEKKQDLLVKEIYYKPCAEYPNGYFYIYTKGAILEEGELPFGMWPFAQAGFDELPTHPRYRSFIRQIKPYQVELNRVASKIAEHQITLGDDKLVLTNGSKMSPAGEQPGIRAFSVSGASPVVIPGRSGDQFLGYMSATVQEMYQVAMVQEELEEKQSGQIDPYALLMQSSRWKKKFSLHVQRFERFLNELTRLSLEITRQFIETDELVAVVGKSEAVNLAEFKKQSFLGYDIEIEPQVEDAENRIGKKLALDRYIQYAGANLSKEDIGKFLRLDPYLNTEQMFSDFTLAYDNSVNDILALDRGESPDINKYRYPDVGYIVQKLSHRMGLSDFKFLPPQVQQNYAMYLQRYEMLIAQMAQEQAALNADMIPTDGPLVRTDLWVQDPANPAKQIRYSLPTSSLLWIKDRMEKQGATMDVLNAQQQAVVGDVVQQLKASAARQQAAQAPQMPPEAAALAQKLATMGQASSK